MGPNNGEFNPQFYNGRVNMNNANMNMNMANMANMSNANNMNMSNMGNSPANNMNMNMNMNMGNNMNMANMNMSNMNMPMSGMNNNMMGMKMNNVMVNSPRIGDNRSTSMSPMNIPNGNEAQATGGNGPGQRAFNQYNGGGGGGGMMMNQQGPGQMGRGASLSPAMAHMTGPGQGPGPGSGAGSGAGAGTGPMQGPIQGPMSGGGVMPGGGMAGAGTVGASSLGTPTPIVLTPQRVDLERQRASLVLEINQQLILCAIAHQHAENKDQPNSVYSNCIKRLQFNLTYLVSVADRNKPLMSNMFPQILTPPPDVPALVQPYRKLQQLYPEIVMIMKQQALKRQLQFQQQQQQQQQPTQAQAPPESSPSPHVQGSGPHGQQLTFQTPMTQQQHQFQVQRGSMSQMSPPHATPSPQLNVHKQAPAYQMQGYMM